MNGYCVPRFQGVGEGLVKLGVVNDFGAGVPFSLVPGHVGPAAALAVNIDHDQLVGVFGGGVGDQVILTGAAELSRFALGQHAFAQKGLAVFISFKPHKTVGVVSRDHQQGVGPVQVITGRST